MDASTGKTRLAALLFCDIEGSIGLKQKLGAAAYGQALSHHDTLLKQIVPSAPNASIIKDTGDGFLVTFSSISDAINAALRFQYALCRSSSASTLRTRIGIHLGQLTELENERDGQPKLVGLAADVAARVMGLAAASQILLTRAAFDDGRQFVRAHPGVDGSSSLPSIRWLAHGQYLFDGIEEPLEIFEIGAEGIAPLAIPRDSPKARRCVAVDEEPTLGWRPAIGGDIPGRAGWILQKRLGEGGFGEVWLGVHRQLGERRVFKFCFDANRLRSLKREMVLFRLLRNALGDRPDIARLHEVKLDEAPFFLESEYTEGGNLSEWAQRQGGIAEVPFTTRLNIVAAVAEAVYAAHSVGVLHKDIKPSNILIDIRDGEPRPRLADFGIGMLTDPRSLADAKITITGFTQITEVDSSRTGTRLYAPPELLEGRAFTVQGDIYSLGVVLYQMVIGNLDRSLAQGWERNVADALLRDDIATCVDGEPNRRLPSALELAARLRMLPQRRAVLAMQEKIRVQLEEAQEREATARHGEEVAKLAESKTRSLLAQIYVRDGIAHLEAGDPSLALLFFVHALEKDKDNETAQRNHRVRIKSVLDAIPPLAMENALADAHADPTITTFGGRELQNTGHKLYITTAGASEIDLAFPSITHAGWINHATFSPDGTRVATASADRKARVWDAKTGEPVSSHMKHDGEVQFIAFSPDGSKVVTTSMDRTARIWDATSGEPLTEPMPHPDGVFDAAFSPSGLEVATVSFGDTVRVWGVRTGRLLTPPLWHPKGIRYVGFSKDNHRTSARYSDPTPICRDLYNIQTPLFFQYAKVRMSHSALVQMATFSPDGKCIATASQDGTARIWNIDGQALTAPLVHKASVEKSMFSPDGRKLLTASMDDTAALWDVSTGRQLALLQHDDGVQQAAFSPDGQRVITTSLDEKVRLWDAQSGALLIELLPQRGSAGYLFAFSADGRLIATANSHRVVHLWNATNGSPAQERLTHLHLQAINSICFSPNGRLLLTCGDDKIARIVDLQNESGLLLNHAAPVCFAAFSLDGLFVVTASDDQTARIWQTSTGKPRTLPVRHQARVNQARFSPDGTQFVTASKDGTARLWETSSGRPLTLPLRHAGSVLRASFDPGGQHIATACADGGAYLFDISPDQRPAHDLLWHAELLAAHDLDESGALVPLTEGDWRHRLDVPRGTQPVRPSK